MRPRFWQTRTIHVCGGDVVPLFYIVDNNRGEKRNRVRHVTGLDDLVEGGNNPRDCSLTTRVHRTVIGACRTLDAFGVFVLICSVQVTPESDFKIHDVVV